MTQIDPIYEPERSLPPAEPVEHDDTVSDVAQPLLGGHRVSEAQIKRAVGKQPILQAMENAKKTERRALYRAVKGAKDAFIKRLQGPNFDIVISSTLPKDIKKATAARAIRILTKEFARRGTTLQHKASSEFAITRKIQDLEEVSLEAVKNIIEEIVPEAKGLSLSELKIPKEYEKEHEKLQKVIKKIGSLLEEQADAIKDLRQRNLQIVKLTRVALANPYYQLNKDDENDQLVNFLHSISIASYSETTVVDAFDQLGEVLKKEVEDSNPTLAERLRKTYDSVKKKGVAASNIDLPFKGKHFWREVGEIFYALLSNVRYIIPLPQVINSLLPQEDLRGVYENNPGIVYREKLRTNDHIVKADTVYTPSPTVGEDAAPEFIAVLQAIENRNVTTIKDDPYPYHVWAYTNLQDINSKLENSKSVALMRLNAEYPLSFRGITIAQDTPFIKGEVPPNAELNEEYKQLFIEQLTHADNFSLDNRVKNKGGGYYFPIPASKREEWNHQIKEIVENAYRVLEGAENLPTSTQLRGFRELVHLGIMKLWQTEAIEEVSQLETVKEREGEYGHLTDTRILETHACLSNQDRGGKTNPSLLYRAGQEGAATTDEQLASVLFARSLLERRRLIIEENLTQIVDFVASLSRDQVQAFLDQSGGVSTTSEGVQVIYSQRE